MGKNGSDSIDNDGTMMLVIVMVTMVGTKKVMRTIVINIGNNRVMVMTNSDEAAVKGPASIRMFWKQIC